MIIYIKISLFSIKLLKHNKINKLNLKIINYNDNNVV